MNVSCTVEEEELDGDYRPVLGVIVTCSRCGETTESYGTSDASINRCLALLREGCDEKNYYYIEGDTW